MKSSLFADDLLGSKPGSKDKPCSVLVVYEDEASREHAKLVVGDVVEELWAEIPFEFSWCELPQLNKDSAAARQATEAAVEADIILVSLHSTSNLCESLLSWADSWAASKRNSESLLAALIGTVGDQHRGFTPIHVRLRNLANRAKMDFLPLVMHSVADHESGSIERVVRRASETSPVLESILRYQPPPLEYGWGINE